MVTLAKPIDPLPRVVHASARAQGAARSHAAAFDTLATRRGSPQRHLSDIVC
jgi:hypothetical protein